LRSRAHIKSHPLHPILVSFPIAFFTSTVVCDAICFFKPNEDLQHVSRWLVLAGICSGLIAAIPGIIDYYSIVPPKSSARKRATKHAWLNVTAIVVFTASVIASGSFFLTSLLHLLGFVLVSIAGWHGGTLVYRNQIGVDHRYAGAGKWREIDAGIKGVPAESVDKLLLNQMMLVRLDGKRMVIARADSGLVAFDDFCTHRGGTLADGSLACNIVQCPWHGSQFDVLSGEVKSGPAKDPVGTYSLEVSGDVYILRKRDGRRR
jgi:uncharacterized membrane protein/nitrite reductase/ring-hydroxylating ferredoxin subunit